MRNFIGRALGTVVVPALMAVLPMASADAQTLRLGIRAGPESIDPHFTASATHAEALKHVFDTLVWSGDKLQLEPRLAESWKALDDTTWEFKLRKGVKFHDGSDFTAEDVKFSIERIPTVSGPNPTLVYVRRVKSTEIVDPHTIRIKTDGPAPTLPNDFIRLFIVSHTAAAGLTRDNANEMFNNGKAAIGAGPYKFVSWTPRSEMILERFDGYWGGKQPWEKVIRKELPDNTARVAQLRAGQVDVIVRAPAADLPMLEKDKKVVLSKGDTIYMFYVELDMREKTPQVSAKDGSPLAANPFRDARVREAFNTAIDRQTLATVVMEGLGKPSAQIVTPEIFGYDPDLKPQRADVKKAKQLLTDAGYPDGFKVTFNFTNDRLPGDRAVGIAIAQMLAKIGVDVKAADQPGAVMFPARTRGDLSFVMGGWGTITGEANYTLSSLVHTNDKDKKLGAFNWRGYSNPELDKLIEDASVEMDNAKRLALLRKAVDITAKENTAIGLVIASTAWAANKETAQILRTRVDEETLAMDIVPAAK